MDGSLTYRIDIKSSLQGISDSVQGLQRLKLSSADIAGMLRKNAFTAGDAFRNASDLFKLSAWFQICDHALIPFRQSPSICGICESGNSSTDCAGFRRERTRRLY